MPIWIPEKQMPQTTYRFSLYSSQGIICQKDEYWGPKAEICMENLPSGEQWSKIVVKYRFKIPEEVFWLELSRFEGKMKFYFPTMQKEDKNGQYQSSCFVRKEICDKLVLRFAPDIEDYFKV